MTSSVNQVSGILKSDDLLPSSCLSILSARMNRKNSSNASLLLALMRLSSSGGKWIYDAAVSSSMRSNVFAICSGRYSGTPPVAANALRIAFTTVLFVRPLVSPYTGLRVLSFD